jgi:hypothetical protein
LSYEGQEIDKRRRQLRGRFCDREEEEKERTWASSSFIVKYALRNSPANPVSLTSGTLKAIFFAAGVRWGKSGVVGGSALGVVLLSNDVCWASFEGFGVAGAEKAGAGAMTGFWPKSEGGAAADVGGAGEDAEDEGKEKGEGLAGVVEGVEELKLLLLGASSGLAGWVFADGRGAAPKTEGAGVVGADEGVPKERPEKSPFAAGMGAGMLEAGAIGLAPKRPTGAEEGGLEGATEGAEGFEPKPAKPLPPKAEGAAAFAGSAAGAAGFPNADVADDPNPDPNPAGFTPSSFFSPSSLLLLDPNPPNPPNLGGSLEGKPFPSPAPAPGLTLVWIPVAEAGAEIEGGLTGTDSAGWGGAGEGLPNAPKPPKAEGVVEAGAAGNVVEGRGGEVDGLLEAGFDGFDVRSGEGGGLEMEEVVEL